MSIWWQENGLLLDAAWKDRRLVYPTLLFLVTWDIATPNSPLFTLSIGKRSLYYYVIQTPAWVSEMGRDLGSQHIYFLKILHVINKNISVQQPSFSVAEFRCLTHVCKGNMKGLCIKSCLEPSEYLRYKVGYWHSFSSRKKLYLKFSKLRLEISSLTKINNMPAPKWLCLLKILMILCKPHGGLIVLNVHGGRLTAPRHSLDIIGEEDS